MDTTNEYTTDNNIKYQKTYKYKKNDDDIITPKKAILNALISSSSDIFQQRSPANRGDLQSIHISINNGLKSINTGPLHILKERYLLTNYNNNNNNNNNITNKIIKKSTNLKCTDIYTEKNYKCKLMNNNYEKIALAYFQLKLNNPSNQYNHQLICPIHDAVQINKNRTYLIITNKNYGDLHSYIKIKRRLTEREASKLFQQICETVKLCHENGIVIRDLKLQNFNFIDSDRTQIQFESLDGSFILDNPNDDTLTEKIGCPLYVAPELITTNITYGGKAADMWSLGIILYTMLVGRYPFGDAANGQIFNKILHGDIIMPHFLSSKVKCLIRSLLMKNPDYRLFAEDVLHHQWFDQDNFRNNQFQCDNYHIVPEFDLLEDENEESKDIDSS